LREPGSTQPGSYLAFLVRIQTVDPSAFEMPVAPGKRKPGVFYFRGRIAGCPLMAQSGHQYLTVMSANDSKRTGLPQ
ncbi:MAG: hypothetical protein WCD59_07970, partial [Pseudolabrys sp.]